MIKLHIIRLLRSTTFFKHIIASFSLSLSLFFLRKHLLFYMDRSAVFHRILHFTVLLVFSARPFYVFVWGVQMQFSIRRFSIKSAASIHITLLS